MPNLSAMRAENKRNLARRCRLSADLCLSRTRCSVLHAAAQSRDVPRTVSVTAPALQRTTPLKKRRAALRPGNAGLLGLVLALAQRAFLRHRGDQGAVGLEDHATRQAP